MGELSSRTSSLLQELKTVIEIKEINAGKNNLFKHNSNFLIINYLTVSCWLVV